MREGGGEEFVYTLYTPVLNIQNVFLSILNYLLTPLLINCNTDILQQQRDWLLTVNMTFIFPAWNTVSRELENFSQNGADASKGKSVLMLLLCC
jgi:hypothetical protein